ncbi:MAG: hypothetical protein GXP41_02595 [Chloroflexi bacterium]|nr:hypothetical protein [Chloroflexota bacterium]
MKPNNPDNSTLQTVPKQQRRKPVTRVPQGSLLFEKIVPALLIILVILTVILIVGGLAVILDIIPHG